METVLADILALTKLNYNACVFADGVPIALRFAKEKHLKTTTKTTTVEQKERLAISGQPS